VITLVLARHLYREGGSFSRCKVNISRRQHFVCVEAVLGEVSEWIVGDLYIGYMLLNQKWLAARSQSPLVRSIGTKMSHRSLFEKGTAVLHDVLGALPAISFPEPALLWGYLRIERS
jgi:hypothetical protein